MLFSTRSLHPDGCAAGGALHANPRGSKTYKCAQCSAQASNRTELTARGAEHSRRLGPSSWNWKLKVSFSCKTPETGDFGVLMMAPVTISRDTLFVFANSPKGRIATGGGKWG